jgi:hypothetical protein
MEYVWNDCVWEEGWLADERHHRKRMIHVMFMVALDVAFLPKAFWLSIQSITILSECNSRSTFWPRLNSTPCHAIPLVAVTH